MSSFKSTKTTAIIVVVLVAGVVGGYFIGNFLPFTSSQPQNTTKTTLTITGSSTVTPLIDASLTKFAQLYPNITVVLNMIDSSAGVTATLNGTCDIGMSSKTNGANGASDNLYMWRIARDGVCMVTNPDITTNLTMGEILNIYNGSIVDWAQLNGHNGRPANSTTGALPSHAIVVVQREAGSGTRQSFETFVYGASSGFVPVSTVVTQSENPLVQTAVQSTAYSIGYVGLSYTSGTNLCSIVNSTKNSLDGFDVTNGSAITPTVASINVAPSVAGGYTMGRNLWLLTKAAPAAGSATAAFLQFMWSVVGQQCIYNGGGVPLVPAVDPSQAHAYDPFHTGYNATLPLA